MFASRNHGTKRRAVAGIVGALLLFLMLFTAGTGYFLYVNHADLLYTQSLTNRANSLQGTLGESLQLTTGESNGDVTLTVTNQGAQASTVVELFVTDSTGAVTPVTSGLPISLNPGVTSSTLDTGVAYSSGSYSVKVLTQTGATFSASYPPVATSLATQAISSGAIGDLYLKFNSYTWYLITNSCPTGYTYCLETQSPDSGSAFAMPSTDTINYDYGFSVTLTNLNAQGADIVLDQYTLIYLNSFYGHSHQNYIPWYIASVGTQSGQKLGIDSTYTPVVLQYNVPTTVYFISSTCVTAAQGPDSSYCGSYSPPSGNSFSPGEIATVFILSNGWEYTSGSYTLTQGNSNSLVYSGTGLTIDYGQNSPFVSTLFY